MTLLALAGGLAGSQNWGQGLQRGLTAAVPAQRLDIMQNNQNQTARALIARGVPADVAQAAATNPALMQQLLPSLFGPKALQHVSIKNALGQDIPLTFDPSTGRYRTVTGEPYGASPTSAGSARPSIDMTQAVAAYRSAQGADKDKALDQIIDAHGDPSWDANTRDAVRAATKAYMGGDVMPTGNPRLQGISTAAKTIGQQVGQAIGMPVSDATYAERKTMRDNLAKTAPATMGGQINFAGTSLGHLGDVAEKAVELGNVGGWGIAPLAHLANSTRQLGTEQAGKANAVQGAVQHYGQEITKFYAGSPGGEAERMRFLKTMDTVKSNTEIADAIRTERDLIPDRLIQLHGQIGDTLGPEEADRRIARAGIPQAVAKINRALAKLDSDGPEARALKGAPPVQAAPAPAPGRYIYDPATGQMIRQQ